MRARNFVLPSVFFAVFTLSAHGADYTAEDIVKFFTEDHSPTRGLCVGTPEECDAPASSNMRHLNLLVNFEKNSDRLAPKAKENLLEFSEAMKEEKLSRFTFS